MWSLSNDFCGQLPGVIARASLLARQALPPSVFITSAFCFVPFTRLLAFVASSISQVWWLPTDTNEHFSYPLPLTTKSKGPLYQYEGSLFPLLTIAWGCFFNVGAAFLQWPPVKEYTSLRTTRDNDMLWPWLCLILWLILKIISVIQQEFFNKLLASSFK